MIITNFKLTISAQTVIRIVIDNAEKVMTISIDNLTVSTKAASGATIGTLTQTDSGGTVRTSNFALTEDSARDCRHDADKDEPLGA